MAHSLLDEMKRVLEASRDAFAEIERIAGRDPASRDPYATPIGQIYQSAHDMQTAIERVLRDVEKHGAGSPLKPV